MGVEINLMPTRTTWALLAASYLAIPSFLAWPLIAYPKMHGMLPNIVAIAFLGCSMVAVLIKVPTAVALTLGVLNATASAVALFWICWAVYTGPPNATERNMIALIVYFTVVVQFVSAVTLPSSGRKPSTRIGPAL